MIVPIPGFDGYFVSSEGEVFSRRIQGRSSRRDGPLRLLANPITGWTDNGKGKKRRVYPTVCLAGVNMDVHRVVLLAFRGQRPDGMVSRHLDGNPLNNCLDNLVYGTQAENQMDRERHGTANHHPGKFRDRAGRYVGKAM